MIECRIDYPEPMLPGSPDEMRKKQDTVGQASYFPGDYDHERVPSGRLDFRPVASGSFM